MAIEECTTSVVYTAAYSLATALFERAHVLERSDVTHGALGTAKHFDCLVGLSKTQPFAMDPRTLSQLFC